MSLRRRLLITLGLSFSVLWVLVATWMYSDLRDQMRQTLDQRLAASARMVAGLVAQLPEDAWSQLGEPVLSIPQSTGVACQIRSPQGKVLLRTHGEFTDQLDTRESGFTERIINGDRWRLFTYTQSSLHITTADRLAERVTLQGNIVVVAVVPFVIALLGSLVLLWLGIRRGLWPLERLREELSLRDPDTLTPISINDAPAELVPVVDALNRLLMRTGDALLREQRFTSNAAHELRTPLTAIKTHVQLASRVPADQANVAICHAAEGIARLQRTLEQLLMLARIDAGQSGHEDSQSTSELIVNMALADLDERMRVTIVHDSLPVIVAVPQELAVAALRNLLENSLQHTLDDQPVWLEVQDSCTSIVFTVRDRGDWPADQSTHCLSQRFWRHVSNHRSQGSGLGLAIVAAIAEQFRGNLDFRAREGGGLRAQLSLPRAVQSASSTAVS